MQMKLPVVLAVGIAAATASVATSARAEFSCFWNQGHAPDCTPNSAREDFPMRLRMTRAVFEADGCEVTWIKVRSDGKAEWGHSTYPDPIVINIAYRCTDARAKPMAIANQQFGLYCPERKFTRHQSGDLCNSFGMCQRFSSSPGDPASPSEPRTIADLDQEAAALSTAWCEPSHFNSPVGGDGETQ